MPCEDLGTHDATTKVQQGSIGPTRGLVFETSRFSLPFMS